MHNILARLFLLCALTSLSSCAKKTEVKPTGSSSAPVVAIVEKGASATTPISTVPSTLKEQAVDKDGKEVANKNDDLIVTSNHLHYDHDNHQATFTGNVIAINGETVMTAERMICYFDEKNDPYLINSEGNVIITRGEHRATSEKATYKVNEKLIVLRIQPILFDGTNTIRGRTITFYEEQNITEVNDSDVTFLTKPKDEKKKEDEKKETDPTKATTEEKK
jgi:lipopolysaccharide transport protein LptA